MNIELRSATEKDFDFLYNLHRATMRVYVEQTWGWEESWQKEHFQQRFDPAVCQIIQFQGIDVGALIVDRGGEDLSIRSIEVLPEYQGRGIGTRLIKEVLEDAARAERSVALQVLKVNRARELYERLGFLVEGETQTHYLMRTGLRNGV